MPPRKTRNAQKGVLNVDSLSKIPQFENLLKNGNTTFIYYKRESCGACQRFNPIWGDACKKARRNNRAVVHEHILPNTSIADVDVDSLPSLIVVGPYTKGSNTPLVFGGPEGSSNAMKTPTNVKDLVEVLNVKEKTPDAIVNSINSIVSPASASPASASPDSLQADSLATDSLATASPQTASPASPASSEVEPIVNQNTRQSMVIESIGNSKNMPKKKVNENSNALGTPRGSVYYPTPQVAPKILKGGGILSQKLLKSLANIFRRCRTRRTRGTRGKRGTRRNR